MLYSMKSLFSSIFRLFGSMQKVPFFYLEEIF